MNAVSGNVLRRFFPYLAAMKRFLLAGAAAVLAVLRLGGQGREEGTAFLALTGATGPEESDVSEIERFDHFLRHPLRINLSSRSRLLSSGLLTPYQVASLLDYRAREGDILSVSELALVDGYGAEAARILAPFLSFETVCRPGETAVLRRTELEATVRTVLRDGEMSARARCRIACGDRWEAALSNGSAVAVLYGKRPLGQLILGRFNARFGQGLALWSGFSMSGLPAPGAFCRRPSGLSPCRSFSGTGLEGAAADFHFGRWTFSVFNTAADRGGTFLSGANAAWYGRFCQWGASWAREGDRLHKAAVDLRACLKGTDLFAEAARDMVTGKTGAVAGVVVPAGERSRVSWLVRAYPTAFTPARAGAVRSGSKVTDEIGTAAGFSSRNSSFSLDGAWHPSKRQGQAKGVLLVSRPFGPHVTVRSRIAERWRSRFPHNRTDLRADLLQEYGAAAVNLRLNGLFGKGLGLLGYMETGWKGERLFLWLRGTLFRIDDWEDRIYAYERDAPGHFSVPAYYGRGSGLSCFGGWKGERWKCWLRASLVRYPWTAAKKPGRAELKCQLSWDL